MSVGIFVNHTTPTTGPGKVAINLLKGLKENGVEFKINDMGTLNGCLQPSPFLNILSSSTLVGPNIMVLPTEMPNIWKKYKSYIVPAKWVQTLYQQYKLVEKCNIDIWTVGIDTKIFNGNERDIKRDCFVYFKNRDEEELESLKNFLTIKKISFDVLKYGYYTEDDFLKFIKESKFCILLTGTESQGIAYMEVLSSNVPCYVINKSQWESSDGLVVHPASSTPYFSDACGVIAEKYEEFDHFLDNLSSFEPRSYILSNHTLAQSAQKYLKLLEKSHAM